ncbi:hypothetical protein MC885_006593, partial [Smutsia gigantea]
RRLPFLLAEVIGASDLTKNSTHVRSPKSWQHPTISSQSRSPLCGTRCSSQLRVQHCWHLYPKDRAVSRDLKLSSWARGIFQEGFLSCMGSGVPSALDSYTGFIDFSPRSSSTAQPSTLPLTVA